MTQKQIFEAYRGVHELTPIVLPYKRARELAALKAALQKEMDVIAESERTLAEAMGGRKNGAGGQYVFPDSEAASRFQTALKAMHEEDDDTIKLPTVDLSAHASEIEISADAIAALEGMVKFELNPGPGPRGPSRPEDIKAPGPLIIRRADEGRVADNG